MKTQDLGFNKENLVTISFSDKNLRGRYQVFKNEIAGYPGILKISGASAVPPTDNWSKSTYTSPDDPEKKVATTTPTRKVPTKPLIKRKLS